MGKPMVSSIVTYLGRGIPANLRLWRPSQASMFMMIELTNVEIYMENWVDIAGTTGSMVGFESWPK